MFSRPRSGRTVKGFEAKRNGVHARARNVVAKRGRRDGVHRARLRGARARAAGGREHGGCDDSVDPAGGRHAGASGADGGHVEARCSIRRAPSRRAALGVQVRQRAARVRALAASARPRTRATTTGARPCSAARRCARHVALARAPRADARATAPSRARDPLAQLQVALPRPRRAARRGAAWLRRRARPTCAPRLTTLRRAR